MQKVTTLEMIVLLNEIGEQAVVAMVERGDSEEHDPIMEMLARKVQIINAIAERVKEMTAVEYLIEMHNILRTYCDNGSWSCGDCPLLVGEKKEKCALDNIAKNPRNIVEIVKKWKGEQDGND